MHIQLNGFLFQSENFQIIQTKPQNWFVEPLKIAVFTLGKCDFCQFNGIYNRSCGMESIWFSWFLNAVDCVIHVQTFMNLDYN